MQSQLSSFPSRRADLLPPRTPALGFCLCFVCSYRFCFECFSYYLSGSGPHRLSPKSLPWPPNWSPFFYPFPGVCCLHSRRRISAQNCLDFHLTLRRLKSLEGSARKVLYHPPSPTCVQTLLLLGSPLCPPLQSLALKKVNRILLCHVCTCCSLSLEHPSTDICLGCFCISFSLWLQCHPVGAVC